MKTIECPKMVENTLHSEEKTIWQYLVYTIETAALLPIWLMLWGKGPTGENTGTTLVIQKKYNKIKPESQDKKINKPYTNLLAK